MKLVTTLLLALLAGLLVYAARRRLKLAFTTAAVVYLLLLPLRLLFAAGDLADRLDSLVWPAVGVLAIWLVLWQASLAYERRKATRLPAPPAPGDGWRARFKRRR